jgi:hypothetical protein
MSSRPRGFLLPRRCNLPLRSGFRHKVADGIPAQEGFRKNPKKLILGSREGNRGPLGRDETCRDAKKIRQSQNRKRTYRGEDLRSISPSGNRWRPKVDRARAGRAPYPHYARAKRRGGPGLFRHLGSPLTGACHLAGCVRRTRPVDDRP